MDFDRKGDALDRAIAYCANQDELSGGTTPPSEVLKVADEFYAWLLGETAKPPADKATAGG